MGNDLTVNVSPFCFVEEVWKSYSLPKEVIIHDTTLREGEQTPGVVFTPENKLAIARKLEKIKIQQIESGFPAASKDEIKAIKAIVKEGLKAKIFGFARAVPQDIDAVAECECYGIVLSFPPSDIHLKYKLKMSREEYLDRAVKAVERSKGYGLYITYSAEDSTRTDLNFLKRVFKTVTEAGADRARIVDTLGAINPGAIKYLVNEIKKVVNVPIEVHCHNDHGLGVANTLAAYEAGASVLSTSINGLGERAGLASTEEVIIALHNLYNVRNFDATKLYETCKLVEKISRIPIAPTRPVGGENIFVHTSGIHQHGVLESPTTYEPYPPELVGQKRKLILGKLSGRHAVEAKLQELNIKASEEEIKRITELVKRKSEERRSALSNVDLMEIVNSVIKKN
ncbi:MAG: homocitrate synthase family protein [Candidatus Bathyarchaeia archaeon]